MRMTLRFALRFVGIIALITIVVLSFSRSNIAYNTLNDRLSTYRTPSTIPQASTIDTTKPVNSIQELWAVWAQVYKATRPDTAKIELMFSAANLPASADGHSSRIQHTEHLVGLDSISALQTAHNKFKSQLQAWPDHFADNIFNGTGV
jgi:hypothetical protein